MDLFADLVRFSSIWNQFLFVNSLLVHFKDQVRSNHNILTFEIRFYSRSSFDGGNIQLKNMKYDMPSVEISHKNLFGPLSRILTLRFSETFYLKR